MLVPATPGGDDSFRVGWSCNLAGRQPPRDYRLILDSIRPTGLMSFGHRHFGVTLPTLFFFLQVVLAILCPLHFQMNFRISKIH